MIARISGFLIHKSISQVIVDTHGVGYSIFVPLTTFYELPDPGQPVTLHIHTQLKQDAISLFGFHTSREKDLFQLMIAVSGIGPKLALNILSGISAEELIGAISRGNLRRLIGIPGIGKKTAERMILELRDRVITLTTEATVSTAGDQRTAADLIKEDALSALVNLGYKSHAAEEILDRVLRQFPETPALDVLLKEVLKVLSV